MKETFNYILQTNAWVMKNSSQSVVYIMEGIAVHEGNIFKGSSEEYNHMHVPPSLLMIYEDASAPNLSI